MPVVGVQKRVPMEVAMVSFTKLVVPIALLAGTVGAVSGYSFHTEIRTSAPVCGVQKSEHATDTPRLSIARADALAADPSWVQWPSVLISSPSHAANERRKIANTKKQRERVAMSRRWLAIHRATNDTP